MRPRRLLGHSLQLCTVFVFVYHQSVCTKYQAQIVYHMADFTMKCLLNFPLCTSSTGISVAKQAQTNKTTVTILQLRVVGRGVPDRTLLTLSHHRLPTFHLDCISCFLRSVASRARSRSRGGEAALSLPIRCFNSTPDRCRSDLVPVAGAGFSGMSLTSDELNYLVYRYLLESGQHSRPMALLPAASCHRVHFRIAWIPDHMLG